MKIKDLLKIEAPILPAYQRPNLWKFQEPVGQDLRFRTPGIDPSATVDVPNTIPDPRSTQPASTGEFASATAVPGQQVASTPADMAALAGVTIQPNVQHLPPSVASTFRPGWGPGYEKPTPVSQFQLDPSRPGGTGVGVPPGLRPGSFYEPSSAPSAAPDDPTGVGHQPSKQAAPTQVAAPGGTQLVPYPQVTQVIAQPTQVTGQPQWSGDPSENPTAVMAQPQQQVQVQQQAQPQQVQQQSTGAPPLPYPDPREPSQQKQVAHRNIRGLVLREIRRHNV